MNKKAKTTALSGNFHLSIYTVIRTLLFFIIMGLGSVYGNSSFSQTKIDINVKKVSLEQLFEDIEEKSEYIFFYKDGILDSKGEVSLNIANATIEKILDETLQGRGLGYSIKDRQVIIVELTNSGTKKGDTSFAPKQQFSVAGTVTDPTGMPIPGVNVLEKGTSNGVVTNFDGEYSINVSAESTLVFSYVGYSTVEMVLNGRTELNVTMESTAAALEEVVVVGYGTQKRVNLTGSVSTVQFDEELENRPITNASQALGGTASGIWVSQNSGKPGSSDAQIRVRGWGTLNNSNPLIIIDGVEGSFQQINPNDIESISVLKDAASAAIYGSKAANGVVLITTKMGRQSEDMRVSVNSYIGLQSLGRRYDVISHSAEHMEITNQALLNDGGSPLFSENVINQFRNGTDPYIYPNTNWFDELFRTAPIQEHNLSINGGSEKLAAFLSFNYLNQEGIVPNSSSQRYSLRTNVESSINDWLTLSTRLNYIKRDSQEPFADDNYGSLGRVFEMLGGATPYIAPYTRDGRFGSVQAIDEDGNLLYDNRNPFIDAANGQTTTKENIFTLNVSAEIDFTQNLSLRTTVSSNQDYRIVDRFNQSIYGYTDTGVETITKNFNREGLEISRGQTTGIQNNVFTTLNYNNIFNDIHEVSVIAGTQYETNRIETVYARRANPPKEGLTQVDAGTSGIQGEGNMIGFNILSYFGRVNYAYMSKYLIEANLRADGSSRFSEGNRWGVFPGFSAGWRLSEEEFLIDSDLISNLKLRASWGQLGNQSIAGYWPYLTVVEQSNSLSYSYNGSLAPGAAITSLVDEDLTWETSTSVDIGMDVGLLDERITIEADYFRKKTEDILVQLPIPLIMGGVGAPFENIGEMTNNGFELVFNYNNQKFERNELKFNLGFNVTYIENEVTKFRGGDSPDQLYLIREGYSYNTLYGFNAIGIYQTDQEAAEHMHSNGYVPNAGELKYEDVNNDGRLNYQDKQALGNTIPDFTFGFSPSLQFQGFDLNLLFQGVAGINMYSLNNFTDLDWENNVISSRWRDAWTPENPNTDIPRLTYNSSWNNQDSSFWVQSIDYVKLQNIQLGYNFSESLHERLGFDKIYLYANAQNVYTFINGEYDGYDPERNTFEPGYNLYPTPRIVSLGINLNF